MRKIFLASTFLIVFGAAATAFAWGHGHNHGQAHSYRNCSGSHCSSIYEPYNCGNGKCYITQDQNDVQITADEAKTKVLEYIKGSGLKGYSVSKVYSYTNMRGRVFHIVDATDASGNTFEFHVSPFGYVGGPYAVQNNK